jgi:hypothetical protein
MEEQKKRKSKNWLGDYKSVIFVPPTPNSSLQKLMQQKEKELRPGGRENFQIKIVETAGKPLERILVNTDPFGGNQCKDKQCLPNRNPKNRISCRRNNVGYELRCKFCPWTGGSGSEPELNPARYFGETGENIHTRMKRHESKFRSKLLHIREGSAFYIHMSNEHEDVSLENEPIDKFFEVNVLKAYQSILTRLVDEGTSIRKYRGPVLNSKSEWHQPKIIRNVIIQGGADTLGLRPQNSPQIETNIPVQPVATSLPSTREQRSTRRTARG